MTGPFDGETAGQRTGVDDGEDMAHGPVFQFGCFVQTHGSIDNGHRLHSLGQWCGIACMSFKSLGPEHAPLPNLLTHKQANKTSGVVAVSVPDEAPQAPYGCGG